jgi:hypothetical protein
MCNGTSFALVIENYFSKANKLKEVSEREKNSYLRTLMPWCGKGWTKIRKIRR